MNIFKCREFTRYIVPVLVLCFSVLLVEPVKVNAEDPYTFEHHITFGSNRDGYDGVTFDYYYTADTKPFVFFANRTTSTFKSYIMCAIAEMPTYLNFSALSTYYLSDGSTSIGVNGDFSFTLDDLKTNTSTSSNGVYKFTYNDKNYILCLVNLDTNPSYYTPDNFSGPLFIYTSKAGFYAYNAIDIYKDIVENGRQPDSGSYFSAIPGTEEEPMGPPAYLAKHNFSKDIIDPDIPIPQLSQISHDGFTLSNREGYAAEVIVETDLLGVQFEKQHIGMGVSDTWGFAPDEDWIYKTHYYNIADSSDVLIDSDTVSIKEKYGFDTVSDLVEDFKLWSSEYPKANTLPSYSWLKVGFNTQYINRHVYVTDSSMTDAEQLKNSGQARTSYYIRYVDGNGNTGYWVKYSFRDAYGTINNGLVYEGSVDVGVVEPDVNGNPVVKDEVSGSVNYDNNGQISYTPPASSQAPTVPEGELDTSLEDFNDVLEDFGNTTQNVSNFVSSMFSFMPGWSTGLLGLAIGAVVMLRFLGR